MDHVFSALPSSRFLASHKLDFNAHIRAETKPLRAEPQAKTAYVSKPFILLVPALRSCPLG
jgi:hypothetical protein